MFTGLVDDVGFLEKVENTETGIEMHVRTRYDDIVPGESIALNGACLTVREAAPGWFMVSAVITTLGRTTIGRWREGRRVNLERAMRLGDRLGGHLVQGHVDSVARVRQVRRDHSALLIDLDVDAEIYRVTVPHGSITVDGVSLTVNALPGVNVVQLSIVEFTERHTTLGELRPGDDVHVESDIIGKYIQRLMNSDGGPDAAGKS